MHSVMTKPTWREVCLGTLVVMVTARFGSWHSDPFFPRHVHSFHVVSRNLIIPFSVTAIMCNSSPRNIKADFAVSRGNHDSMVVESCLHNVHWAVTAGEVFLSGAHRCVGQKYFVNISYKLWQERCIMDSSATPHRHYYQGISLGHLSSIYIIAYFFQIQLLLLLSSFLKLVS